MVVSELLTKEHANLLGNRFNVLTQTAENALTASELADCSLEIVWSCVGCIEELAHSRESRICFELRLGTGFQDIHCG